MEAKGGCSALVPVELEVGPRERSEVVTGRGLED